MLYGSFRGKLVGSDKVSHLPLSGCLTQRPLPPLRDPAGAVLSGNPQLLAQG